MYINQANCTNESKGGFESFDAALASITPLLNKMVRATNVYGLDPEDIFQELSLKAYTCWLLWEPDRNVKYSTFAHPALTRRKNELVRQYKSQKMGCGNAPISLYEPANRNNLQNGEGDILLVDLFATDCSSIEDLIGSQDILDAVVNVIETKIESRKARQIIIDLLMGATQTEVAHKYLVQQSLVSYYLKHFRKLLKTQLAASGYNVGLCKS